MNHSNGFNGLMPWGEHIVADTVTFHVWNMAYHEGQISYILQLLGVDPMG